MLSSHARFSDGSASVEAGIAKITERFEIRRLRVAKHLHEWLDDFSIYHRKDGMLVKERDDLLAATRYALMMKRHAKQVTVLGKWRDRGPRIAKDVDYPIFGH